MGDYNIRQQTRTCIQFSVIGEVSPPKILPPQSDTDVVGEFRKLVKSGEQESSSDSQVGRIYKLVRVTNFPATGTVSKLEIVAVILN